MLRSQPPPSHLGPTARPRTVLVLSLLWLLWGAGAAGCQDQPAPLRLLAASSLTEVLPELTTAFATSEQGTVEYSFAATNRLARQIEAGAPADVFLSANTRWDQYLLERGLTKNGQDHIFAENRLVLIVPRGPSTDGPNIQNIQDILNASRRVALAGESVPAGQYADLALSDAGLLDALRPKIVRGDNVSLVLHWVATGEVGAGIVYQTDARRRADEVSVVHTFEVATHGPIEYTAAAVTEAHYPDRAEAFLAFLRSSPGRSILELHGFSPR